MSATAPYPPLLVLGCHRSGTSAITGLLHTAAGLFLGDVLPPSRSNPSGYFESAPIVVAHNHILRALDRDWTCPPASFEAEEVPRTILAEQVSSLAARGAPWGVKDPRLLFMLPAWEDLADEFMFIGVVRSSADVVRSIAKRDQIPQEAAGQIVGLHLERLAALHRTLGFPIVDFSATPTVVVERVRGIASALGLPWDNSAAATFLKPSLIHHRSTMPDPDDNVGYLTREASTPITEVTRYSAVDVRKALDGLPPTRAAGVRLDVGPRFSERRRELWKALDDEGGSAIDRVVELLPAGTPPRIVQPLDVDYESLLVGDAHDVARRMSRTRAPSHVLAPGLLEATPPARLDGVLRDLARFTQSRASVVLDGFVLAEPVDTHTWERGGFATSRVTAPFHHAADEINAAARRSGWRSTLETPDPAGRTTFQLFTEPDLGLTGSPDAARIVLLSLEARVAALERDLERYRRMDTAQPEAFASSPLSKDEAATELERTKAALERVTDQYERLRNRRLVKLALRIADAAKPLIGRVRR